MRIKQIALAVGIVLLVVGLWFWRVHKQHQQDNSISSLSLPGNDNEKIVVNPMNHTIDVITPLGVHREFLPGMRPSSVEVRKDGSVVVTSPQWGVEHSLIAGIGMGNDGLRFGGGLNVFYYKQFDLGFMVTDLPKDLSKVRMNALLSWTVWHDVQLGFSIDNAENPGFWVTERF